MRSLVLAFAVVGAAVVLGSGLAWKNGTFAPPVVPKPGSKPWAKRMTISGVENFGEVVAGKIYRGAQPTAEGYESLKKLGVKTIISFRDWHSEEHAVASVGLEPVAMPLQADVRGAVPPTPEEVERFLSVVLDPAKQPVYFHCAHGKDRTGTMCAVLRIEVFGWTNDEAFGEMESFGFNRIWTSFSDYVRDYKPKGSWRASVATLTSETLTPR